jgi:hypothetical protein
LVSSPSTYMELPALKTAEILVEGQCTEQIKGGVT